ncbi:MAG: ferredoxin-NAD reductase [Burkholderiales bacterium RIFCSPHIGHO2_12_FULL_61_11]|nr:MAG: ferredoxin-NAD reductase [Burkholderiales bacterium RIFCSPHIGHO2_12_FULL_61_11]
MLNLLQTFTQSVFLAIEKIFNSFFGERLNPFYYLGAITYFLLWIVIATGLYLYAFFETSVAGAFGSVQALTHGQWFAGGVLRSVHRYASDGLVLGMALHLIRHFTFDRHRGFHWFSWVSGVILLWLTYASGVNGYMLPWDRLSQFVVTATTEWFDVLPVIGGSMTRNFISNANVSDRLFSLLSFLHIGIPLVLMAVLWVHTQRTPSAKTNPPRPLMIGIVLSLVALAIIKPAVSQGQADMATLPASVNFDWFYLPVYPLIEHWGPLKAWLFSIGATLLLLALPWLPPRRRGSQPEWSLAVHPDECIIEVRSGETLLDAGLRQGLPMPFECRNGGCGACKATLLHGEVRLEPFQESALTSAERAAGKTLLCCAEPLSDVEIEYVPQIGPKALPIKQYVARVSRLERLTQDVMRLSLRLEDGSALRFHAGQYINIILDDGAGRSFSFAAAPHAAEEIELHVRLVPGGRFTTEVFTRMKVGDQLRFEGPLGAFTLRQDTDKPILFVAGSTGFAPVKSMIEHAFHCGLKRPMILYWGVRNRRDLYLGDLAEQWAREHANFTFVPVLSEPRAEDEWTGRTGLVHEAILADFPDLSKHQVYACGSVQMVEAAQPAFIKHGISSDDCFSDAFRLTAQKPLDTAKADVVKLGGSNV